MHYIAPTKKNYVYHLANGHKELLHDHKELNKWTLEELEQTHKEIHDRQEKGSPEVSQTP